MQPKVSRRPSSEPNAAPARQARSSAGQGTPVLNSRRVAERRRRAPLSLSLSLSRLSTRVRRKGRRIRTGAESQRPRATFRQNTVHHIYIQHDPAEKSTQFSRRDRSLEQRRRRLVGKRRLPILVDVVVDVVLARRARGLREEATNRQEPASALQERYAAWRASSAVSSLPKRTMSLTVRACQLEPSE